MRKPTEAQKAAAAERRERFREMAETVSNMSEDERMAIVARVGAIVSVEGRALSIHNTCLILYQCPTASMVGGFAQWLKAGRVVKKGEKGLSLWVPTAGKKAKGTEQAQEAAPEATGGEVKAKPGFIMGTVFDVSQTQPKDTPEEQQTEQIEETEPQPTEAGLLFA